MKLKPDAPDSLKKAVALLELATEKAKIWHVGSAETLAREAAELLASLFRDETGRKV